MIRMTLRQAAQIVQGSVIGDDLIEFGHVCHDSREAIAGSLFFARQGENTDGHHFVQDAIARGAVAVVTERSMERVPQLIVADSTRALGSLAHFYRNQFTIPVIGVTGSVGKTSTKEMIACVLRAKFCVHANVKSFNGEIGVPLTLLGLEPSHQAAVLEMGMRGRGQIAYLAEIAAPTMGVVTNIGISHAELLGTQDAIAEAKGELLEALSADATAILNADDRYVAFLRSRCPCPVVTYGMTDSADFRVADIIYSPNVEPSFTVNGQKFLIPAPGVHHVSNAAAACATAAVLQIPMAVVAEQLRHFHVPEMRMEVLTSPAGQTILNDVYNAAPLSMESALETLTIMAGSVRRSVAILGDMRELGEYETVAHREVGVMVAALGVRFLITVGKAAQDIASIAASLLGFDNVVHFEDARAVSESIADYIRPLDVILIKGSRAMGMEQIVQALLLQPGSHHGSD